ncbi:ASCH domain [Geoglobus ahangari]|uniref:ASCH domain n=1 Tax=Geoglobus ahangari TaxID=113653 RepID=A0A0F7IDP1_9EURY|nr:ASCH domain-containing protein [Geoglobus ahangari]AKG91015.1 ASCH domain [Geoglobus ahangari]
MKGLIVRQPFADMIVSGEKKWEVRTRRTGVRGEILILSEGHALGTVELSDVLGPFTPEELAEYRDLHKADYEFLKEYSRGRELYAWVLKNPRRFAKKVRVDIPRGAQVWVNVELPEMLEDERD